MRAAFLLAVLCLVPVLARADEPKTLGGPADLKRIGFRCVGPTAGGRVSRACGVPGDPRTYYAATAAGGVWKSDDGGFTWNSVFDEQPISSIGSIAVAPSDASVVYVGSGEANIRGNVAAGNGIYRSTDAGKTWTHVWKQEGQIGTMIVHPKKADVAYAAVLGHAFGPNEERGVYRTRDGGKTWKRVLFKDKDTGASDVCLDPSAPDVLFAGLWQTRRQPWELTSGGPGSGLYTSRDGGDTWTQLVPPPEGDDGAKAPPGKKYCKGLPEGIWGKIAVAVAPSDGKRIYALIEADRGGLFRSDDGGETWERVSDNRALRQRAWYFTHLTVHPTNADVVYFPQVPLLRSLDGGKTLERVKGPHHGDHHDLWIDPTDPRRMIDSNDGGVDITLNGGKTWFAPALPIAQFYRIETDNRTPYHVMGSMQDIGTGCGPSNSLSSGGIGLNHWEIVGGGEAGHVVPDPSDPNVIWAGEYGGTITRYDRRTRQAQNLSIYPFNPSGHGAEALKYRFQWTAPIHVSPHAPHDVYHAANVLFRTSDGGKTWKAISGDLTRDDKSKQKWSGGPITGDNTGAETYCTIFAVAESPRQKGVIWAGSDDGLVHVSRDDGKTWDKVTPKGMPEWGTVWCIEPSPFDAGTAYVVAEAHRLDDMKPYLFRTTDFGKTWETLSDKLPQDVYLHAVRADPARKGMLYLGTERGLAFSRDDGTIWEPLKLNLPTVAVHDLKVKGDDLVVGTNGRSIWILDDLTPLREFTADRPRDTVHLLPPRPATRWRQHGVHEDAFQKGHHFSNPPGGAVLHFFLPNKVKDRAKIRLEVLNEAGDVLQTLDGLEEEKDLTEHDVGSYSEPRPLKIVLPTEPGLHRVVWDLRHRGAVGVKGARVDSGRPAQGPVVAPGTYTLRLTVEGKSQTQKLEVRADPRLKLDQKVLAEQEETALRIRADLTRLATAINGLRSLRRQIETQAELLKNDPRDEVKDLLADAKKLDAALLSLERELHNPDAKIAYDVLAQKGGAKLYSQLGWLFEQVKDTDGPVSQGVRELHQTHRKELERLDGPWHQRFEADLKALNERARKLDVPILVPPPGGKR